MCGLLLLISVQRSRGLRGSKREARLVGYALWKPFYTLAHRCEPFWLFTDH
jgi:hypothetical protein